jgi:spermidine synthase
VFRGVVFALFVASGFSSLLYQVVWLRLAFAAFGIVTPVLSIVLSVFMLGLALGSWGAGRLVAPLATRPRWSPIHGYALAELGIGAGAFVVPAVFGWGARALLDAGETSSGQYLLFSALIITVAVLGFATLMGTTFPLMMAFLRAVRPTDAGSFSSLYLANVVGAMVGVSAAALVLIEALGFRRTLLCGALVNLLVSLVALLLPAMARRAGGARPGIPRVAAADGDGGLSPGVRLALLFTTGLTALGMEVVWIRAFTPVLLTNIYAFAALLSVYLLATWVGSAIYRHQRARGRVWRTEALLGALFIAALLPLVLNDPRWNARRLVVLASIVPVSALLGYLTPRLIDDHAHGEPRAAGLAYALNVTGCIAGPLVAGYLLLPFVGVKWSLIVLSLAFAAFFVLPAPRIPRRVAYATGTIGLGLLLLAVTYTSTYEDPRLYDHAVVRRDHIATVVSEGEGMDKQLLVNGIGLTSLTTVTKFMAHLPLVMRAEPPRSTLVIGLGMGTTFRSLASWGGRTTAVELVPSVRDAFGFYFADTARVLARPATRIIVDDGRRFLTRTGERYDVITLDPSPPVEAAGSSLLYSVELYRLLRVRLAPGGVVQQWFPGGEDAIERAVATSLRRVFPHVKVFRSVEGWGYHFIASEATLQTPTVELAMSRMPAAAVHDLMEWAPDPDPRRLWRDMLAQKLDVDVLAPSSTGIAITDDRPFNEYFWLRRSLGRLRRPVS